MEKMATSLSTYWVKFFTAAGFPIDVATKHAVVFSNNRIKPDMLPDLDKPSLKEMGITLMGDMIAILRYAKKVSEEMTCERFLVDNIDDDHRHHQQQKQHPVGNKTATTTTTVAAAASINLSKPQMRINQTKIGVKKLTSKQSSVGNKSVHPTKLISTIKNNGKSMAIAKSSINTTQIIMKNKKPMINSRAIEQTKLISNSPLSQLRKRKVISQTELIDSSESDNDEWSKQMQKRLKTTVNNDKNIDNIDDDDDHDDNNDINETKNYKLLMEKQKQNQMNNKNVRTQQTIKMINNNKILEQKRTVFDRLGDSSVTSTTNLTEPITIFNITGLGSDIFKRNSSVFNRLGERDVKNDVIQLSSGLNNANGNNNERQPHGILKSKIPNIGINKNVKLIMNTNNSGKLFGGTMHADHERNKKKIIPNSSCCSSSSSSSSNSSNINNNSSSNSSNSVKQLIKTTKTMKLNSNNSFAIGKNTTRRDIPLSRLASERADFLPAKSRLGLTGSQKQVTFNKIATVKHIKKPGVFSRLGV